MSKPGLLSRKPVIYTILITGIVALTALNFWGWFFVRSVQDQIIDQFRDDLQNVSEAYATFIGQEFFFDFAQSLPELVRTRDLIALETRLADFKQAGEYQKIFVASLDRSILVDEDFGFRGGEPLRGFTFNDSLFNTAITGVVVRPELSYFDDQTFLTAYAPIRNLQDDVTAILIIEASRDLFSSLEFMRSAMLYIALGGLGLILLFAGIVVAAFRRLLQIENQLNQQSRLAHLGQMAAMVAHEIRNPLSIIKGSAEVLQKRYAKEDNELFDFIPDEINRLNRLVNDFLQFARRRELQTDTTSADKLVRDILKQIDDARISLNLEASESRVVLAGDAFRQIILNIVDNARKSTPDDGSILIESRQSAGSYIISIKDTGEGMDEETLRQIFDPFFSTRATGSGLGMAITQQLIEQMKGEIDVQSELGTGTTVALRFPMAG